VQIVRKNCLFIIDSENRRTLAEALQTYSHDHSFSLPFLPYRTSEILRNYLLVPFWFLALNRLDSASKNWQFGNCPRCFQ